MKALGVDLAGSRKRPTGICLMDARMGVWCSTVFLDREIMSAAEKASADMVAIDAPLSLPPGRENIDSRSGGHLRVCDRELLRRKIKFFPITLGPMRMLTRRGISLCGILREQGKRVIEVYPGAAQDILNIARQKFPEELREGLESLGIRNLPRKPSVHELDAVTAAYVGLMHLKGRTQTIGDEDGGGIVLPVAGKKV